MEYNVEEDPSSPSVLTSNQSPSPIPSPKYLSNLFPPPRFQILVDARIFFFFTWVTASASLLVPLPQFPSVTLPTPARTILQKRRLPATALVQERSVAFILPKADPSAANPTPSHLL